MEIMYEKQIQTNILVFMIALQMIQIRLLTSSPFFVSLCFVFLDQLENSPHHYSGHESGIISICARGPGNKKKGKVLIWFFSKLPIRVQSCIRTDPSLQLISLRTQQEQQKTDAADTPAPRFKGPETRHRLHSRQVGVYSLFRHLMCLIHIYLISQSIIFINLFSVFSYSAIFVSLVHFWYR